MANPNLHFASLSTTAKSTLKQLKLSEAATFLRGSSLSKDDVREVADVSNGVPCVLYGHLYTTYGEIAYSSKYVTDAEIDEKITSKAGDVLMPTSDVTPRGLATATCVMFDNAIVGGDINILRPQPGIDGRYLSLAINSQKQKLYPLIVGSTIRHLHASDLKGLSYFFPSIEEQQKIAEFFTALDEKLSIVSNVCRSFERLYKSTISDLLAQRIRFKSNNQKYYPEWNHCRIGDIFKVSMCKRVFKDETSAEGDVPFYKIGTLGKEPDSFISKELFEKYVEKYSYPKKGDTLISCSGTVGKCVVFDGKASYYQDSNIIWLEPINTDYSYDERFLTLVLENYNWGDLSASTIKRIYSSDILEKLFVEPCIDEQRAIADFAFDLKEKVAICNKKLEALKQLKKAFMQRMFV